MDIAMRVNKISATPGELLFAILSAAGIAALAGLVGFLGGTILCARLLVGEATEWALIVAPATALLFGVAAFGISFLWILHYGDPPADASS